MRAQANEAAAAAARGTPRTELPPTGPQRPRRKREREDGSYKETRTNRPRYKRPPKYMDRTTNTRGGAKRHAIEMGAAALERTTNGAYDWRDDGMKKGRRK